MTGTALAQGSDAPAGELVPPPPPDGTAIAPPPAPMPAAPPIGLTQLAPEKKVAKNAVYVELGGNGGFYTVNYERMLRDDAAIRVGLMYMSISVSAGSGTSMAESSGTWITAPIMFEYLGVRSGSHHLNLGAGLDLFYFSGEAGTFQATASSSGILPAATASLGYRYSNPEGGFVFKLAYTPMYFITAADTAATKVQHWAGMSFGWRFGT